MKILRTEDVRHTIHIVDRNDGEGPGNDLHGDIYNIYGVYDHSIHTP